MLDRCYNPNHTSYKYYGEKGVTVCKRWLRFDFFLEDLRKLQGYNLSKIINGELELDKDIRQKGKTTNCKIYSPQTCMLVDKQRNLINTSRNKLFFALTPDGKILKHTVVKYFAEEHDLDDSVIHKCLKGTRAQCKGYYFSYDCDDLKLKIR